jgi:hypothetical protein
MIDNILIIRVPGKRERKKRRMTKDEKRRGNDKGWRERIG